MRMVGEDFDVDPSMCSTSDRPVVDTSGQNTSIEAPGEKPSLLAQGVGSMCLPGAHSGSVVGP